MQSTLSHHLACALPQAKAHGEGADAKVTTLTAQLEAATAESTARGSAIARLEAELQAVTAALATAKSAIATLEAALADEKSGREAEVSRLTARCETLQRQLEDHKVRSQAPDRHAHSKYRHCCCCCHRCC